MYCNNCGAYVKDSAAFCNRCGNRLENIVLDEPRAYGGQTGAGRQTGYYDQPPYPAAQPGAYAAQPAVRTVARPAKKRKSKLPLVIGTIIGMIIVAGGVIFAMMHFDKPYEKTAENFLKALQSRDYSLLYEVTSNDTYDLMELMVEELWAMESYGVEMKFDYNITDSHKVKGEELSEFQTYHSDLIADINNLYVVNGTLTLSYTGADAEEMIDLESGSMPVSLYISKIDGKWKVLIMDFLE